MHDFLGLLFFSREGVVQTAADERNRDEVVPGEERRRRQAAQVAHHRRPDPAVQAQVPDLPGQGQGVQLPAALQLQRPVRQPQDSDGELTIYETLNSPDEDHRPNVVQIVPEFS